MIKEFFQNVMKKTGKTSAPEEIARQVSAELWRSADDASAGKHVSMDATAFMQWSESQTQSMSTAETARFYKELRQLDNKAWIEHYMHSVSECLDRDEILADIALKSMAISYGLMSGEKKPEEYDPGDAKTVKGSMQSVWGTREQIRTARKEISNFPFWDLLQIPRPPTSPPAGPGPADSPGV
ncbi:MAG: hypothetical protein STSR0009_30180 [Methanoregula sp.]